MLLRTAIFALGGLSCLAANKQTSTLTVTAVAYRAIPHERTSYYALCNANSRESCTFQSFGLAYWRVYMRYIDSVYIEIALA